MEKAGQQTNCTLFKGASANGLPVTGLTWSSRNPDVVSLSTDDPPVLTALAAGHVTIIAGTAPAAAAADVTVFRWKNQGT